MKGIVLLITVGFATSLFAQTPIIKLSHNKCRWGDRLLKWQVEYKDPGNSGENILWDYSSLKIVDDNYKINLRRYRTNRKKCFSKIRQYNSKEQNECEV